MSWNRGQRELLEGWLVALFAFLGYFSLYSELPIDDTIRFTAAVEDGRFEWDPAHLLMQPATVVWHQWFGFGQDAVASQHHINTFAASISLAILCSLTIRIGCRLADRFLVLMAAGLSFNLVSLATSGHMKLLAMPFLTLSLFFFIMWDRPTTTKRLPTTDWRLWASASTLGIAGLFLANSLAIVPFQCIAVFGTSVRERSKIFTALLLAVLFGVAAVALPIIGLGGVYLSLASTSGSPGFLEWMFREGAEAGRASGFAESFARSAYSIVMNFVHMEHLGPILRAKISGQLPENARIASLVSADLAVGLITSFCLALVYALAALGLFRREKGYGGPWAQFLGIASFAFVWNLNEADFYYQLTIPTFLMFVLLPYAAMRRCLLVILVALFAAVNIVGWAVPKARYPFIEYGQALGQEVGDGDLVVGFYAYPGKHCLGFFVDYGYLDDRSVLLLDHVLRGSTTTKAFFKTVERRITEERSGKIVVLRVFDPSDFNAPWPELFEAGVTKSRLLEFFNGIGDLVRIGPIAEIPSWRLDLHEAKPLDEGADFSVQTSDPESR